MNRILPLLVLYACAPDDFARISADKFMVSPCQNHDEKTFSPFRWEADFLRWHGVDVGGQIEIRKGFRPTTYSDLVVLDISDVATVQKAMKDAKPVTIGGKDIRLSISLQQTCPDFTQVITATNGEIMFESFDPSLGGKISGHGRFDLIDQRRENNATLATNVEFVFSMTVRKGFSYTEFASY